LTTDNGQQERKILSDGGRPFWVCEDRRGTKATGWPGGTWPQVHEENHFEFARILDCSIESPGGNWFTTMRISRRRLSFFIYLFFLVAVLEGTIVELKAHEIHLPKTIGAWTRQDSPRVVNSNNIFSYMNGAGELYLGYRFHRLEVFDYVSENQENILVELYFMETSDDAFGLLSLDWGGEPVSLSGPPKDTPNQSLSLLPRALYGGGLLRIWSDNLYVRVMAFRETPASKQAALTLGKSIAVNRKRSPEPELLKIPPLHIGSACKLRKDRLSFFRSYLVLNSIYYLSQENILDLNLWTEGLIAPYEPISNSSDHKRIQFLLVKYENHERARKALKQFHDAYLPEHETNAPENSVTKDPSLFKIEDGWLGYKWLGKYIVIVFECPDRASARITIQKSEANLLGKGGYLER
jgi:hypothetical protein